MVLSPLNGSLKAGVTILLVVTISGNPSITSLAERSSNPPLPNANRPKHAPSRPSRLFASGGKSNRKDAVESEKATGSKSLTQLNTQRVQVTLDPLGTGLASAASDLEEIVRNANLLADVSNTLVYSLFSWLTRHTINLQMHPLAKGAWSLVNAVDELARAQPGLDTSVQALINAIDSSSKLAKENAPLKKRYTFKDSVVRDMLREIIKGAHIVKVYCEKRPESVYEGKLLSLHELTTSLYPPRSFDCEDDRLRSR